LSISTFKEEFKAALLISDDLSYVAEPNITESSSFISFSFACFYSSSFSFFSNFYILELGFFKGLSEGFS